MRPVHTTSFYKTNDRIPSYGIAQKIRDVERCYMTTLRYLVRNADNSSAPIVEADYERISEFAGNDLGKVVPGLMYLTKNDYGANGPAMRYYSVPSNMGAYINVMDYFSDVADRITNVPAALHGTAVGSGANRTFRGAAMLVNNATNAIQAAVGNIDEYVFTPMGELLYNYNMQYEKDPDIKGDCQIVARGVSGLLQKEIDRQNSYEVLQLIVAAAGQFANFQNGDRIFAKAVNDTLDSVGFEEGLRLGNPVNTTGNIPGPAVPVDQSNVQGVM